MLASDKIDAGLDIPLPTSQHVEWTIVGRPMPASMSRHAKADRASAARHRGSTSSIAARDLATSVLELDGMRYMAHLRRPVWRKVRLTDPGRCHRHAHSHVCRATLYLVFNRDPGNMRRAFRRSALAGEIFADLSVSMTTILDPLRDRQGTAARPGQLPMIVTRNSAPTIYCHRLRADFGDFEPCPSYISTQLAASPGHRSSTASRAYIEVKSPWSTPNRYVALKSSNSPTRTTRSPSISASRIAAE